MTILRKSALPALSALLIAACGGSPSTPGTAITPNRVDRNQASKVSATATPRPMASAAVTATVAPEAPLPSVGLLVSGRVTVDPSAMLAAGIATRLAGAVSLIGNNGPGLISDNGIGLIANNGGGIIANNSGGLISNNSGSLVGKSKFGLLDVSARAATPVQGLVVRAVSLRTGQVLAGPIATDAEGRYRLGFLTAPDTNLRFEAVVNNSTDPGFSWSMLVAPKPATVANTDAADTLATHMITVLARRVQNAIDQRRAVIKKRRLLTLTEAESDVLERKLDAVMSGIPAELIDLLDQDGRSARRLAEAMMSFANLGLPAMGELLTVFEDVQAFDVARPVGAPAVTDAVLTAVGGAHTADDVDDILAAAGMSRAQADDIQARLDSTKLALNSELSRVADAHMAEVLEPVFDTPELEALKPLIPMLVSQRGEL